MAQDAKDLIGQIRRHAEENNDLKLYQLINQLDAVLQETPAESGTVGGDRTSVGNISGSTGVAVGRGAQAHVEQGSSTAVHQTFRNIYEQLGDLAEQDAELTPETAENAQIEVAKLEAEALKGDDADESFLAERFRNIALMGEDILDVVTATLLSPAAGIAEVVRKIAKKAREEEGLQPAGG